MQQKHFFLSLLVLVLISGSIQAQTNKTGYSVKRHIHVGGKGGWDYITAYKGKLYIAHDSLVNVIDEKTGDSVAVIPGTFGAHGIAFAPLQNKGYITAGKISSVIVFDVNTSKVLKQIKTPAGPDAIIYEPFSKFMVVCNGRAGQATFISPLLDKVIDTLALGGKPEEPASDEAGNIYINLEDKSELVHINTINFTILDRWKIGKGTSPSGLAIDRAHHRLFLACDNSLMVVLDAANGKVLAELTTGAGCDGAAFDPATGNAFSPNGQHATLTVIHEDTPDTYTVTGNVPTKRGARTITLDKETGKLYLPTAEFGAAPAPTAEHAHPRPSVMPGTFEVIEVGK